MLSYRATQVMIAEESLFSEVALAGDQWPAELLSVTALRATQNGEQPL